MKTLISSRDHHRPFDLIAMGRVAVDFYAEQIGSSIASAQSFRKYLGGCAGNIAVGCSRLGLNVSMLSRVGGDELGQFLKNTLRDEGVDTSMLQTSSGHLTGLVVLGVDPPDHFPLIFFRNDCADMAIDKELFTREYFAQAQALLITGTGLSHAQTREATLHAVMLARSVNTKIILDIDYRPVLWGLLPPGDGENRFVASAEISALFATVLPLVDLVVGTAEECRLAGNGCDITAAVQGLRCHTSVPIVVKKGADGAMCFLKDEWAPIRASSLPVTVLNVLGAGDGFMAGLLSKLLRAGTFDDALRTANAVGAIVVSRHGCSPAIPSCEELDYFLAERDADVALKSATLARLHHHVLLKEYARREPMPIFAFCHRWQLEEVCARHRQPFSMISTFKTALGQAFSTLCRARNIAHAFVIGDADYGRDAIREATANDVGVIVAIEKSGTRLLEWIDDASPYEILHARPANWGVKVLMHFDASLSSTEQQHQINRIKELERACRQLERALMLEVIPADKKLSDESTILSVTRLYQEGIYPYWWKLPSFATLPGWKELCRTIDAHDDKARVVILGGEAKSPSAFAEGFSIAQSSQHGIGFAVGRSIFWPSFVGFIQGTMTIDDVKADVTKRFFTLYDLWHDTSSRSLQ